MLEPLRHLLSMTPMSRQTLLWRFSMLALIHSPLMKVVTLPHPAHYPLQERQPSPAISPKPAITPSQLALVLSRSMATLLSLEPIPLLLVPGQQRLVGHLA